MVGVALDWRALVEQAEEKQNYGFSYDAVITVPRRRDSGRLGVHQALRHAALLKI